MGSPNHVLHWLCFWDTSANVLTAFLLNCGALSCVWIIYSHWYAVPWWVFCVWGSGVTLCEKDVAFAAHEAFPLFVLDGMGNIVLAYLVSKSLLILLAISKNKFYFNYVLLRKSFQLESCSYILWSWSTWIWRYRKPCFLRVVQLLSIWYYVLKLNTYQWQLPFY